MSCNYPSFISRYFSSKESKAVKTLLIKPIRHTIKQDTGLSDDIKLAKRDLKLICDVYLDIRKLLLSGKNQNSTINR